MVASWGQHRLWDQCPAKTQVDAVVMLFEGGSFAICLISSIIILFIVSVSDNISSKGLIYLNFKKITVNLVFNNFKIRSRKLSQTRPKITNLKK